MIYKTELHAHSTDISSCSNSDVTEIVSKYAEYGYDTVVLANHFNRYTCMKLGCADYEEFTRRFYAAYEKLKQAAGPRLHILFGAEIRFDENVNDYLLFGADLDKLLAVPDMWSMGIKEFAPCVHKMGMLLYQAHPFRVKMTLTDPKFLDGLEVYNGHPGHNSSNDIAAAWARKYGLPGISGTDYHDHDHFPTGGILTKSAIKDENDLLAVLRGGDYSMITRL